MLFFSPTSAQKVAECDENEGPEVGNRDTPAPIASTEPASEVPNESATAEEEEEVVDAEEESRRLAWALQREEEDLLYRLQMDTLQQQRDAGLLDENDMLALQAMLGDGNMVQVPQTRVVRRRSRRTPAEGPRTTEAGEHSREEEEDEEEFDEEEEEAEEEEEEESEEWDYERLLQLGQVLGGTILLPYYTLSYYTMPHTT
jgi:hypothetical protein